LENLSLTAPEDIPVSAEKIQLLKDLKTARLSNNTSESRRIQSLLNQTDGAEEVTLTENPDVVGRYVGTPSENGLGDFQNIPIMYGGLWSSATQTNSPVMPNAGRIWVAGTQYSVNGDTCRIYYSDNGGLSWTFGYSFYFVVNMDFRPGELDLELCYDGGVVWIYGVAGYNDATGRAISTMFRINTSTGGFNGYLLNWPGYATTTNFYYNPRITSDNTVYTSSTFLYLSTSFDSAYGSSQHMNRQKFARIQQPFAVTNTIIFAQPSTFNNGGFYWNTSGLAADKYLWTDIAYYETPTGGDRIMTTYSVYNNPNIFLAWSDDFGATVSGNSIINELNVNFGAKMVFNGGSNNQNGLIAYVRQFSGTDWDPYYRNTTDGGTTWNPGFIDGSNDRARSVDIIAPRNAVNIFKVGYVQDSSTYNFAHYTGGVPGAWQAPGRLVISPIGVDTTFTKVIAGFRNGGGDDCFALYSPAGGFQVNASIKCQTTVGTGETGNEVPSAYELKQNYPNPFNPATDIRFSIPVNSMVKLTVYDAAGRVVKELVNSELSAGSYNISFNAENLASAVYFYRLDAGEFSAIKKMVLIK